MTTAISCAGVDYLDVDYLAEALEVCARSQLITNLLSRAGKRNQAVVLFWRLISAKHSDEYMTSYLQRPDKSHPTCHQFSGPDPALLSVATWICSCNRRQTGRSQHRLFVEFSVLIGQSGQGYQKNAFFFFFPPKHSVAEITVGLRSYLTRISIKHITDSSFDYEAEALALAATALLRLLENNYTR